MKVYVASSWKNLTQQAVVTALVEAGHQVYDFRNPGPGVDGFSWKEVDPNWRDWNKEQFCQGLKHESAVAAFNRDVGAIVHCDVLVLVLPCGRSSHAEFGFAEGRGKLTIVLMPALEQPELMYRFADAIVYEIDDVVALINGCEKELKNDHQRKANRAILGVDGSPLNLR